MLMMARERVGELAQPAVVTREHRQACALAKRRGQRLQRRVAVEPELAQLAETSDALRQRCEPIAVET